MPLRFTEAVQKVKDIDAPMSRVADESLRAYQSYRQSNDENTDYRAAFERIPRHSNPKQHGTKHAPV